MYQSVGGTRVCVSLIHLSALPNFSSLRREGEDEFSCDDEAVPCAAVCACEASSFAGSDSFASQKGFFTPCQKTLGQHFLHNRSSRFILLSPSQFMAPALFLSIYCQLSTSSYTWQLK